MKLSYKDSTEDNDIVNYQTVKIINILTLLIEAYAGAMMNQTGNSSYIWIIHSVSMVWSILYHTIPSIRTNSSYKLCVHTMFYISAILLSVCLLMLVFQISTYGPLVWIGIIVLFIGPSTLVASSLI